MREEYEKLPDSDGSDQLGRAEFEEAVKHMRNGKATGADEIPAEVYKNSAVAKEKLFEFLKKVWDKEYVPARLAVGIFVMLFKKGSPDDCANYRCICLLNHAYKILSVVLMKRLIKECELFLSEWQAGFRAGRGCRDNILLLRILYDFVLKGKLDCVVTFIDYKAAFDSLSHKFIDAVLNRAGASRKSRAIFRAIYEAAKGIVRVNGILGKKIFSEAFNIGRGVVQGDIVSPLLFILALDQIIQKYDTGGVGVTCNDELTFRVLGYADDAALSEEKIEEMTVRLTALAEKSQSEADMTIRMDKTFSHHVQTQDSKIAVTKEEIMAAQEDFEHKCDFCSRRFKTLAAMRVHRANCPYNYATTEEVFEVEDIVGVFGRITSRWFLVKYAGYEAPEWSREHLLLRDGCRDSIRCFWDKSGLPPTQEFYDIDKNKCEVCGKTYKRAQDLKAHKTREKHHLHQIVQVSGKAKTEAIKTKKEEAQALLPTAKWGDVPAENCWQFKYLGSIFTPDGSHMADVRRRIARAQSRHGKMRHIWKSKVLHPRLKMRLYVSAVCSIMIYGSEAWRLDDAATRALNGANSRMVSAITGRPIREEATPGKTYDVVAGIRATRLRWLGCILRLQKRKGEDRLVKKAVKMLYHNSSAGDILMDAPATTSWDELCEMAEDKKEWQGRVRAIKDVVHIVATRSKGKGKGERKRKRSEENDGGEAATDSKTETGPAEKPPPSRADSGEEASEESEGEGDEEKEDDWGMSKPRVRKALRGRVKCNDGFAMSVQASSEHACTPRNDTGPYTAVEVGYPNEMDPLLMPYCDALSKDAEFVPPLYVNVPTRVIRAVVHAHAGLRDDSEALPPLIERDEDGYEWAAPAIPPSPSPSEEPSTEETSSGEAAAAATASAGITSVIQMGAPPPPPPPLPPVLTAGTNPPTYYSPPSPTYIVTTTSTEESEDAEPPYVPGCDKDINRTGYLRYKRWARRHPEEAKDQHPKASNANKTNERVGALTPPLGLINNAMSPIDKAEGKEKFLNDSFE